MGSFMSNHKTSKAYREYKGFIFLLLLTLLLSCDKEDCPPCSTPTDDRISFEMNFLEYSDNNYFIDDVYVDTSSGLNIFNQYYGNIPSIVNYEYYVNEIEVYKSINTSGPNFIHACAYIDLPKRLATSKYSDSLRFNGAPIAGEEEAGRFWLLSEGRDYLFHRATGNITFLWSLNDHDAIAVAYKTPGIIYGEFFTDLINNHDSVAVLKLVRPRNLQPTYLKAWKFKMKNIYKMIPYRGEATDVEMDIYLKKADGTETNSVKGKRLLELFGFDTFHENGDSGPDGKFDNFPGITYERESSEIIFPVLEPFGLNIPQTLEEYKYDLIYDTAKTYLTLPANYFVIKGKYNPI